ncbi:MAG: molybdate ABC transporter substrate-binding protein [Gammaproteobacteria bacterium]|nr:molybdate ABC transporter substrate-binding protein [Gammaproteobacteria bacterium]
MESTEFTWRVRCFAILLANLFVVTNTLADQSAATKAKSLRIAVATNFTPALKEIALEFTEATNFDVSIVSGSTGKLYAQIKNGMDADLFLAADQVRIRRLVDDGMAFNDTLITYAEGRLVWWHPGSKQSFEPQDRLDIKNDVNVIAYAQPDLAPYGKAAEQALSKCFRFARSRIRFVHGENVGQTYAHVASGNADAGLVALASIKLAQSSAQSSYASVPRSCHEPIKQDAVVLKSSQNVWAARQFLQFLLSEGTQRRMTEYGYTLP